MHQEAGKPIIPYSGFNQKSIKAEDLHMVFTATFLTDDIRLNGQSRYASRLANDKLTGFIIEKLRSLSKYLDRCLSRPFTLQNIMSN